MAKSRLYTRKSPKMSINHEQIQKIVPDTCTREADRTERDLKLYGKYAQYAQPPLENHKL